ncbi:hypothetical protein C8F04DRAFT_1104520 [Mycena alexandri]|uniref:F-box domain-containing protein n=1 Tax=Mycena alexandri TaxID=1745969 RepID=A0AAD6WZK4_9AGAR|nr:hypothetical protein C8F04DRAFT_1104520 [Mycena alexandri]
MSLLLSDLPTDIIREVTKFLELPDPISLLRTCSALYTLSIQRSFWISVLERTQSKSTISCPQLTDLSQYTLETLKDFAISWLKLQRNWNRPFPLITQPVTFTRLSEPAEIIFNVPGTDILVLNMSGNVLCWDAKLSVPIPFPAIETGRRVTTVSAPSETRGECSLAFLTTETTAPFAAHRHVARIKHQSGKAVDFTSFSSKISPPDASYFQSIFITEGAVGTAVVIDDRDTCVVTVGVVDASNNSHPDHESVVKLPRIISSKRDMVLCLTYQGHLYNLVEDGLLAQIQHISRNSLRSARCEQSGLYCSEIPSAEGSVPFCFMTPSTPFYGVSAVFIRLKWDEDADEDFVLLTFLPNTLTNAPDDGDSSPLGFDLPCVTQSIPGALVSMSLVWTDHSGFNVTVVVEASDTPRLVLVRYHPETNGTSVHTLAVPESIDLYNLNTVCVDDTAGAVHMIDKEGVFSTLRYV